MVVLVGFKHDLDREPFGSLACVRLETKQPLLSPTDFSRLGVLSGFIVHAVSTIPTLLESASSCVSHGRAEWVLEELRGVGESFAKQAT